MRIESPSRYMVVEPDELKAGPRTGTDISARLMPQTPAQVRARSRGISSWMARGTSGLPILAYRAGWSMADPAGKILELSLALPAGWCVYLLLLFRLLPRMLRTARPAGTL